jgi:uncharacterized protein
MPPFAFGGHDFEICGKTALFWPQRSALIVADLHLEKASWFASRGQMLPPYDSLATIERLAKLIEQSGAGEIWCLGDNFHDVGGPDRLSDTAVALLHDLTRAKDWHWVTGNHDEALPEHIGGTICKEAKVAGILLRHQADPGEICAEISGHFHPKIRASAKRQTVSRPCFVRTAKKLILPSFGALTGGLEAGHPAIASALGEKAEALLEAAGRLVTLPI